MRSPMESAIVSLVQRSRCTACSVRLSSNRCTKKLRASSFLRAASALLVRCRSAWATRPVGEARLDFLVEECLVLELKAVETLAPIHVTQVISYLKATKLTLALLVTFNVTVLRRGIQRVIQSS